MTPNYDPVAPRGRTVLPFGSMSKEVTKVEYIPADEYVEKAQESSVREYEDPEPYGETAEKLRPLAQMAVQGNGVTRVNVPRELHRKQVVNAFVDAFEMIGGVPRLSHWADQHPSAFYKLYARLLPTTAQTQLEHSGEILIKHVIPRGPLDENA